MRHKTLGRRQRAWSGCIAATSEHSRSTRQTASVAPGAAVARPGSPSGAGSGFALRYAGSAAVPAAHPPGPKSAQASPHGPCSCRVLDWCGSTCAGLATGAHEGALRQVPRALGAPAPGAHAAAAPAAGGAPVLQEAPPACACGARASTTLPACPVPAAALWRARMRSTSAQARALAEGAWSAQHCSRLREPAAAPLEADRVALVGGGCSSPLSGAHVLPRSWPRAACCHLRTASRSPISAVGAPFAVQPAHDICSDGELT